MNSISASDNTGEYGVQVSRGLTKEGEEQVQIAISRMKSDGFCMINMESIICDIGTWIALINIVDSLRTSIQPHELTKP